MFVEVIGYESDNWLFDAQVQIDYKFNKKLYNCFKKPTFVFMYNALHSKLTPSIKKELEILDEDSDMEVEEMLSKDILTVLIDKYYEIEELVALVEQYTQEPMRYLIIEEI